jgi:tetratricopeptide (TPR) repeat protein
MRFGKPSGTLRTINRYRQRQATLPLYYTIFFLLSILLCMGTSWGLYQIPAIHDRLYWRIDQWTSNVRQWFNPRASDILPTPVDNGSFALKIFATTQVPTLVADLSGEISTPTPPPLPTYATESPLTATPSLTPSVTPSPTITPTPTILPSATELAFSGHEYQKWNNCAPANLAMLLKFWGWKGDQLTTAGVLKPDPLDRNVRPDEILHYIESEASGLKAYLRVGADITLIKTLLTYGYPVLIETGYVLEDKGWMGHYELVTGYDDTHTTFTIQDSYLGPNHLVNYVDFDARWQNFNRLLILVVPQQDEARALQGLGRYATPEGSWEIALKTAQLETQRDPTDAFAWHNLGASWAYFNEKETANAAFDEARKVGLPWRMLWYQFDIYRTYYETGRLADLIALADHTLEDAGNNLEESFFWRGWAKYALGDSDGALKDFAAAIALNSNFSAAIKAQASILAELADTAGKPSELVQGKVVLDEDRCCIRAVVSTPLQIKANFTASSSAGKVTQMRVVEGQNCGEQVNMDLVSWEPFVPEKTYNTTAPLSYANYAICVQYQDEHGNLSYIFVDEIALEGLRPTPTP